MNDCQLTNQDMQEIQELKISSGCGTRPVNCFQLRHFRFPVFSRAIIKMLNKYLEQYGPIPTELIEQIVVKYLTENLTATATAFSLPHGQEPTVEVEVLS